MLVALWTNRSKALPPASTPVTLADTVCFLMTREPGLLEVSSYLPIPLSQLSRVGRQYYTQ